LELLPNWLKSFPCGAVELSEDGRRSFGTRAIHTGDCDNKFENILGNSHSNTALQKFANYL
jgi:hypothetical protein